MRVGGVPHNVGKIWTRLQLFFRPHLNWRFSQEVKSSKMAGVPISGFWDSWVGSPKKNDIWVQPPWPIIENTIRGKVVVFSKFRSWWVLWVCVCLWLICTPKVFQLCINELVVWFVQICRSNRPTCHSS
jgi:hypothetical protein